MFQLELFEFFFLIESCLEITSVQTIEVAEEIACFGLFGWKEFSAAISFFGHPFEVAA